MTPQALDYLFDLQGYLHLEAALTPEHVNACNAVLDQLPDDAKPGSWWDNVHVQDHHPARGINLQQIYEAGEPFEKLIDHAAWIELVNRYADNAKGLFIDENFASIRRKGESINLHSGGDTPQTRTQFQYRNGQFCCGQINILIALTDIGPGDGGTVVVPGSHKSNLPHPSLTGDYNDVVGRSADNELAAVEVHMKAGDALLFVDAIAHGSAARINDGQRRILVYRYGPGWGNNRFGLQPSDALLARLTDARRAIVQPIPPRYPA